MRLEQVLPAYREGKAIDCKTKEGDRVAVNGPEKFQLNDFTSTELLSDDWSIIDDPITITREQFERAWMRMRIIGGAWASDEFWEELQK